MGEFVHYNLIGLVTSNICMGSLANIAIIWLYAVAFTDVIPELCVTVTPKLTRIKLDEIHLVACQYMASNIHQKRYFQELLSRFQKVIIDDITIQANPDFMQQNSIMTGPRNSVSIKQIDEVCWHVMHGSIPDVPLVSPNYGNPHPTHEVVWSSGVYFINDIQRWIEPLETYFSEIWVKMR